MSKGYLILEDGHVFGGERFGAPGEADGELVFTTGMTGYLETLTDPSYFGQMVVQTFPLIGNVGVIPADFESRQPALRGYIVREWCRDPSNFRCEGDLDTFLKDRGVAGLCGVDTRAVTRLVRERGVMNARISDSPACDLQRLRALRLKGAVEAVGCREKELCGAPDARFTVALWDFGAKEGIVRALCERGARVWRMPPSASPEELLSLHSDGIMLSNGPGDPADNPQIIESLRTVSERGVPVFGICLGHQLLALARGARTVKLHYGHRGANQPVRDTAAGRVYITSQNHGYAVDTASLPAGARMSCQNANDGTCEGLEYTDIPAFSVQFHPEACAGPRDTAFLFDRFFQMMEVNPSCR